mmetsp:Transcript_15619/g.35153  ORF Transcript_15619/g.35153 Transcript_15619/m.35153 type:complete len:255 (-) Transcript_15619:155-919(-)
MLLHRRQNGVVLHLLFLQGGNAEVAVLLGQGQDQRFHAHVRISQRALHGLRLSQHPAQRPAHVLVARFGRPRNLGHVGVQVATEPGEVDPRRVQNFFGHVPRRPGGTLATPSEFGRVEQDFGEHGRFHALAAVGFGDGRQLEDGGEGGLRVGVFGKKFRGVGRRRGRGHGEGGERGGVASMTNSEHFGRGRQEVPGGGDVAKEGRGRRYERQARAGGGQQHYGGRVELHLVNIYMEFFKLDRLFSMGGEPDNKV